MANTQWRNLLSSNARIQIPWVKVTIGDYTFGVFDKKNKDKNKNNFYIKYNVKYPNYIQRLTVSKINGQVNQYTLNIAYPITQNDDPNFFEKVFSSVSDSRKIVFSYGDAAFPNFIYKDEVAIITKIQQSFSLESSTIQYTVNAVSAGVLASSGSYSFSSTGRATKPSDEIKKIFRNKGYGLQSLFTGMSSANLENFIAGDDQPVVLESKINISILDYISYLVSCMVPEGSLKNNIVNDLYMLTIHDETSYDEFFGEQNINGPYFKVTRTSYKTEHSDAFVIDVGYNTSTIVTNFSLEANENYALYYDYQKQLHPNEYVDRINSNGKWEKTFAPTSTSKRKFDTENEDRTWWTNITKYPVKANITVQGLLRPAMLMTYVRLNVIFPGGHKHISSGLYLVTKQTDSLDSSGYRTQLNLTKISGDTIEDTPTKKGGLINTSITPKKPNSTISFTKI